MQTSTDQPTQKRSSILSPETKAAVARWAERAAVTPLTNEKVLELAQLWRVER